MIEFRPTETDAKIVSWRDQISLDENQVTENRGPQHHSISLYKNDNSIRIEDHNQLHPGPDSLVSIGVEMLTIWT